MRSSALVVGLTNEPSGLFAKTGYAADTFFTPTGNLSEIARMWAIKAAPGVTPSQLVSRLQSQLKPVDGATAMLSSE